MKKLSVCTAAIIIGLAITSVAVHAQTYPSKPVKIVVPFAAGGGLDATVRVLAKQLGAKLGQAVIIENRTGANGAIGTAEVVKAPADGYTLLAQSIGYAVSAFTEKSLPYDSRKDLTPVLIYSETPMVLVVNPKVPVTTPQELLQLVRAKSGTVTFGAGDQMIALMNDMLRQGMKADIQTIMYSGSGKSIIDLLGGHINALMTAYVTASSHIQAGTLRPIAITGATRLPLLPDVPTLSESIVPGYDISLWYALLARSGTSKDILTHLNRELVAALQTPEVMDAFKTAGIKAIPESLEEANQRMARELVKWEAAATTAGFKTQ